MFLNTAIAAFHTDDLDIGLFQGQPNQVQTAAVKSSLNLICHAAIELQ
jgi:hypothetical protein